MPEKTTDSSKDSENLERKHELKKQRVEYWVKLTLAILTLVGFVVAAAFIASGVAHHKNRIISQVAIVAIIALILLGSALATDNFLFKSGKKQSLSEQQRLKNAWLTRLAVIALLGHGAIMLYAAQHKNWEPPRVAQTAAVGFLVAGASWLIGALIGFIFGIPHTRRAGDRERLKPTPPPPEEKPDTKEVKKRGRKSLFEDSTSLEEISDWLTKIMVGVGLTELKQIPMRLDALGLFIATGMDESSPNKTLGLSIFLYFVICGFLFGYLWGRLYMPGAFDYAANTDDEQEDSAAGSSASVPA